MWHYGSLLTADSTGNNVATNNGVVSGPGMVNTGGVFANTNMTMPYNSNFDLSGGNYAMSAWFNSTSFENQQVILSNDTWGSNFDWDLSTINSTTLEILTDYGLENFAVTVPQMNPGEWHDAAIVGSGNNVTIYLDGVAYGTTYMPLTNDSQTNASIGAAGWNNPNSFFEGTLDEVRAAQGSRSAADIAFEYANIANPSHETLFGFQQSAPPTVSVSASDDPVFGQSTTLTATVATSIEGGAAPTGTVAFFDGTTYLGDADLNTSGVAEIVTTSLSAGDQEIRAIYEGDSNYSSGFGTTTVNVSGPPQLTIDNVSVIAGNTATFTVSLNEAQSGEVDVDYQIVNISGEPATESSSTLEFLPGGSLTQTISVPTASLADLATNEDFFVELSNASGAEIANDVGIGTVLCPPIDITATTSGTLVESGSSPSITVAVSVSNRASSDITGWTIDWDDDSSPTTDPNTAASTSYSASHEYAVGRKYHITVEVTEANGTTTSETLPITIADGAYCGVRPKSAPTSDQIGTPVTYSAANPVRADTYNWTVTYDSSTSDYTTGTGPSFSFTPDQSGSYSVSLSVTDADGTTSTTPATVTLYASVPSGGSNPTLSIDGAPTGSVTEGSPLLFVATMANPTSSYSYAWSLTESGVSGALATSTGRQFNFTPDLEGTYALSLVATDAYGLTFSPVSATFVVTGVAPSAVLSVGTPSSPSGGSETATISLTNAYDPSATEMGTLQYAFSCTPSWQSTSNALGTPSSVSSQTFTFHESGVYAIEAEVIDGEGLSTIYQSQIVINDLPTVETTSIVPTLSSGVPTAFTVTFGTPVKGVVTGDFAVNDAHGSIASVAGVGTPTIVDGDDYYTAYTVYVTGMSVDGAMTFGGYSWISDPIVDAYGAVYQVPGGTTTVAGLTGGQSTVGDVTQPDVSITIGSSSYDSPASAGGQIPIDTLSSTSVELGASVSADSEWTDYSWSLLDLSSGANTSSIDHPDESDPTLDFTSAGNYRITVIATDTHSGLTGTSVADVTVTQVLTNIKVTALDTGTNNVTIASGGQEFFFADAVDQFGNDMVPQPTTFTWAASGGTGGSIDSNGLFTDPGDSASDQDYTITATANGVTSHLQGGDDIDSYSGDLTVTANTGPTVAVAASATVSASGKKIYLSVLGDDADATSLTYSWAYSSAAGSVVFDSSTKSSPVATVGAIGNYDFVVTIHDAAGLWITSDTGVVNVSQVVTTITVAGSSSVAAAGTATYSASATDQFNNSLSTTPTFAWSASSGQIDNSGNFSAPDLSMPCQITVWSGNAQTIKTVQITDSSPDTSSLLGDSAIESLFEQALGAPGSGGMRQTQLNQLTNVQSVQIPSPYDTSLTSWTPGPDVAFPTDNIPTSSSTALNWSTSTPYPSTSATWSQGSTNYTSVETNWINYSITPTYNTDGSWTFNETYTASFRILTLGGQYPMMASGSLSFTLDAQGSSSGSSYTFDVTATATAAPDVPAGGTNNWLQTTTNNYHLSYSSSGSAAVSGSGDSLASYYGNTPYSNSSTSQPDDGANIQSFRAENSYSFNPQSGTATVESSGNFILSYAGGGSVGNTWFDNEHGNDTTTYDYKDTFSRSGDAWSMSSGSASVSEFVSTFGETNSYGTSSSSANGATMTGSASQSSQANTSVSMQENSPWSSGSGWGVMTGSQTSQASGFSQSSFNVSGTYSLPATGGASSGSGSTGSGTGSGSSQFSFSGGAIQCSGTGTQNASGSSYSDYDSTGYYNLDASGVWQPVSGSGSSYGNSSTSSSFDGDGTYSYPIGPGGAWGSVSGTFSESGSGGTQSNYNTESTLGPSSSTNPSGWSLDDPEDNHQFSSSFSDQAFSRQRQRIVQRSGPRRAVRL